MAMHPEIQAKAQLELEQVVGKNRLPDFDDYGSLHYVQAILLECTRWLPVVPLGVPHQVITDDYYDGYFIPEGTVIVPVGSLHYLRCCSLADRCYSPERMVRTLYIC